jgi:hypothetical protein
VKREATLGIGLCLLIAAACSPIAPSSAPPAASGVLPATPPVPTPVATDSIAEGSSAGHDLPAWSWTPGVVDLQQPRAIAGIWQLGGAYSAVAVRGQSDADERDRAVFLRSDNGLEWGPVAFPVDAWYFEYGQVDDGVLTVFGTTGRLDHQVRQSWQTTDGLAWTNLDARGLDFGPGWIRSVAHGTAGWLAVGVEVIDPEHHRSHLLFSSDLREWMERPWPRDTGSEVVSDGSRFVTREGRVTENCPTPLVVQYSDDATTWTTADVAILPEWHGASSIGGTDGGFALGGQRFEPSDESSNPLAWWSPDGVDWTEATVQGVAGPAGQAALFDIQSSPDGLIASGNGDPLEVAIWLSDEGRIWTQVTPLPDGLNQLDTVARAGPDLIVSGRVGTGDQYAIWRGSITR